jgi:hypothetical protein
LNSIEEGLPSATVYDVYQSGQGQTWVGTGRGVSLYHLDADVDPPITSIETRNSKIKPSAEGIISVEFSGLDKWKYTSVERLLYSYRLDDGQWSPYNSATAASFTNLASGHHRLTVKAMDRNWNADPKPPLFEFIVILPWFKDPRLIAISICALGGVLFFAWLAFNRHRQWCAAFRGRANRRPAHARIKTANPGALTARKDGVGTFAAGTLTISIIFCHHQGSAQIIESNLEDSSDRTRVKRIRSVVDRWRRDRQSNPVTVAPARRKLPRMIWRGYEETIKLLGDRFRAASTCALSPAQHCRSQRGQGFDPTDTAQFDSQRRGRDGGGWRDPLAHRTPGNSAGASGAAAGQGV